MADTGDTRHDNGPAEEGGMVWSMAGALQEGLAERYASGMKTMFLLCFALLFACSNSPGSELEQLEKAAAQGDAQAQSNLGDIYRVGGVVPRDYAKSFVWYQKAAVQGNAAAQTWVGDYYASGRGTVTDMAKAAEWTQKAAAQGYAKAQYALGVMHSFGLGFRADEAKAAEWYRKAANQGHAQAQEHLGHVYTNGTGVQKDDVQAFVWLDLAAAQGSSKAVTTRTLVEKRLTPEQKAQAQKLSSELLAKMPKK